VDQGASNFQHLSFCLLIGLQKKLQQLFLRKNTQA
jgi:hypothetical protein